MEEKEKNTTAAEVIQNTRLFVVPELSYSSLQDQLDLRPCGGALYNNI